VKLSAIILLVWFAVSAFAQNAGSTYALDPDAEQEILRLVNLERAHEGLTSLRFDANLQRAARAHSQLMADAHQLSHQFSGEPRFSQRLAATGASFAVSAENVALNQTAEGAHTGLMNSPGHRKNILNPEFNAIGIGVIRAGENIWVTQDFAREYEPQTPQEGRNQVIAAFQKARRAVKLQPVGLKDEPRLQNFACRMANNGELDTNTPLGLTGGRSATSYTESDLSRLASTAMKLATDPSVQRISVAVCFARSPKYESGMNWVTIVAY
jgi:hypothetical protein